MLEWFAKGGESKELLSWSLLFQSYILFLYFHFIGFYMQQQKLNQEITKYN